ncbi:cas scaffolding protein family member 4 isoform X1 [Astyanax mexicanus]|uniref:cas scaffolding protein family member 4 isoform X1 n=1 Tax=Astyanax mexicanus TaxID=7994 RepID=UPI0020CB4725|nr:cas scaffolding protein family member 4 isoform X1 [Astyanax mexicanus]
METLFAKALYDNTAESQDELEFQKGDVVVVKEQKVEGSPGWWRCSLHGREGLAPANRLIRLSAAEAEALGFKTSSIYQIPSVSQPVESSPTYEVMDRVYKVPSKQIPVPFPQKHRAPEVPEGNVSPHRVAQVSFCSDVYDVPSLARKGSLNTTPSPRPLVRNKSLLPPTQIPKRYETMDNRMWKPCQNNVYAVPPSIAQESNYDIPVPSNSSEVHQRLACGYSTMPNPRKSEWIYDVPVTPEKSCAKAGIYNTMSPKGANPEQLYDTLPARVSSSMSSTTTSTSSLYDIPKPSTAVQQCINSSKPVKESIYDIPPCAKPREPSLDATGVQKLQNVSLSDSDKGVVPLEYRGKSGPMYDFPRVLPTWGRQGRLSSQSSEGAISTETEESVEKDRRLSVTNNQRSSMASMASTTSSSSRSSCDSLMLSSPSPEPLREITMPQEEVSQQLMELQDMVCRAIPKLMDFVSSSWRSREHLGEHLQEIHAAAEGVANSVTSFLDFVLDVRGNARRLTDSNLQTRLQKQLSIVEDSGLILQQSVDALGGLGWSLDALVQDPGQPHTPDQLERFVMVARTVPEDVKRLVSILNANGKLLFRSATKESETPKNASPTNPRPSQGKSEPPQDSEGDDNDYVQLQTKTEFEQQQQQMKTDNNTKPGREEEKKEKQISKPPPPPPKPASTPKSPGTSQISDHCRLYFGAIKKAITVFISSLEEGQPPEKFIAHGKLVIMVGQRLMESLCGEAQNRPDSQELLCKSNHLCALLKQLAVATKKAALHFPDQVAIQEAQDFAKELAQRAHNFRMSLDG